jgi:RND family efflux transporter MFP subunit
MERECNRGKFQDGKVPFHIFFHKIAWNRDRGRGSVAIIFFVFFLNILLSGCNNGKEEQTLKRPLVSGIETQEIKPTQVNSFYETSGTVRARTVSIVASRVMGVITAAKAQEGDPVNAGDVLAVVDNRDAVQRLAAAEAAVNETQNSREMAAERRSLADVTYERYKNLYDEKVVSRQEFDQIEMQKKVSDAEYARINRMLERTKANLEEVRVNYGFYQIRAPISGVVTEKKIETGSMAAPGMHLYTVEDTSQFKIEAAVDEGLAGKVFRDMTIPVIFDQTGEQTHGRVTKVVPFVDPGSRTFSVEITLHNAHSLKSGSYGKVLIPTGKKIALLVPDQAIVERGQLTGVFIVDNRDIIAYRLIKTGKTYGNRTEVLSGLREGDKVIVSGVEKAVDGGLAENK